MEANNLFTEVDIDRIISMPLEDRTPFDAIEAQLVYASRDL